LVEIPYSNLMSVYFDHFQNMFWKAMITINSNTWSKYPGLWWIWLDEHFFYHQFWGFLNFCEVSQRLGIASDPSQLCRLPILVSFIFPFCELCVGFPCTLAPTKLRGYTGVNFCNHNLEHFLIKTQRFHIRMPKRPSHTISTSRLIQCGVTHNILSFGIYRQHDGHAHSA
jgi:hypothetical protein